MANEFVAKNGLISQNNSVVNGSLTVIGNQTITGSLIQGLEGNIATGDQSHAEGSITQAIGNYSHAEGDNTRAKGDYSHAEGLETIASGSWSHAEGYRTIASANYQHVQGQWNVTSSVESAFIVGNGTDDNNRSNLIYAAGNEVQISGSLNVSAGITGSLQGTASWANNATTASYILNAISSSFSATASYALTSAGGGGGGFPFSGSGVITGSLLISGSGLTVTGSLNMLGPIIYPIITQTNNYTLQLSDAGDIVEMNVGTANTVTVPSSSVTNFSTGTQITLVQYGAGQTTVTTGSTNVLLRSAGNATKIAAQYGGATLIKRGTDEWYLLGNITV